MLFDPIHSIEVLTWLLGDHLGSTTITTNVDGTLASGQTYTAWGTTRSGSTSTDRQYTGQISEPQLGIYFYNTRYYDPYLAQFTQPDSIIQDSYYPLDWNRYAYVRFNPVNNSDLTGHMVDDDFDSREGDPGLIQDLLMQELDELIGRVGSGAITDLEAFAHLTDYAAWFTPNCASCFVQNLGAVLTGDTGNLSWINEIMGQINSANWDKHYDPSNQLGQSGFASIFQDPGAGGGQPHHFWFYVQMGFQQSVLKNNPSGVFPYFAVIAHETVFTRNPAGNSFQDVALGFEGVNLGVDLWAGTINPSEVGDYLRRTLSPGSQRAALWENRQSTLNQIGNALVQVSQSPY